MYMSIGNGITKYSCSSRYNFGSSCDLSCLVDEEVKYEFQLYGSNSVTCSLNENGVADWSVYPLPYCTMIPDVDEAADFDFEAALAAAAQNQPTVAPDSGGNGTDTPQVTCK